MVWHYLDLADYLLIAEEVLGVDAEVLAKMANLALADSALNAPAAEFGGVEFYEDFAMKASVLCVRLIKNHALPDGNKRTGYLCTVEFAERNGFDWIAPPGDASPGDATGGDETVGVMKAVASGDTDEDELARWMSERLRQRDGT